MFFAQLTPAAPEFAGQALAFLVAISALAVSLATLRRKPSIEAEFITKAEHKAELGEFKGEVRGALSSLRGEIQSDFRSLNQKLDERLPELNTDRERTAAAIYKDIREIEQRVARIEGHASH